MNIKPVSENTMKQAEREVGILMKNQQKKAVKMEERRKP